jgi:protein-tyrosine phosphatase
MFTDIHSHILPDIDDGCSSIQQALELLDSAARNSVENIIITPHFNCESNPLKKNDFLNRIKDLDGAAEKEGLSIKTYPGAEVRISHRIVEFIEDSGYIVTLAGKNKYMLFELPLSHEPYRLDDILFEIKLRKIIPILAHPERYDYLEGKIRYLKKIHDEGLLMQVNNSSLIKGWTYPAYRRAVKMLKSGIVDFIGSDCHYMKGRFSNFIDAYKKLVSIMGRKEADVIAETNPNKILSDDDII